MESQFLPKLVDYDWDELFPSLNKYAKVSMNKWAHSQSKKSAYNTNYHVTREERVILISFICAQKESKSNGDERNHKARDDDLVD